MRRGWWTERVFIAQDDDIGPRGSNWRGAICADTGSHFINGRQPAIGGYTQMGLAAEQDHVAIGLVHQGAYMVGQAGGRESCIFAGHLFMVDGGPLPTPSRGSGATVSYLCIPRVTGQALAERPADRASCTISPLQDSPLAPLLVAQLTLLHTHGAELTQDVLHRVLCAAIDFGKLIVSSAQRLPQNRACGRGNDKLLAVQRYIEANLHRHDLTPVQIARAVNCSRAQLYRLFEAQAFSVWETLREARLNKSFHYLKRADHNLSIGEIASMCGFSDQSAFGKQFRQRFGVTPGEVRREAQRAEVPSPVLHFRDAQHACA